MDPLKLKKFELQANILKSLAHPTRLYIVNLLDEKELCVKEITDKIEADMSTVSRHLSVLKNAGIIKSYKQKSKIFYSLKTKCVLGFFGCIENVLQVNLEENQCCISGCK
jgi:ArsR family transcriptional regulator, arsenate/arsenite/antimonite-responsive transcriptional repressor